MPECGQLAKIAFRRRSLEPRGRDFQPPQKKGPVLLERGLGDWDLAATYFPTHRCAVSSALEGLTAEFGMGSGVPPPEWPPGNSYVIYKENRRRIFLGREDARPISTGSLKRLLALYVRPINQVVYLGPSVLAEGRTYLEAGFPLRCLQRLSFPNMATQRRRWRDD